MRRGFTMIELAFVLAILAVLLTVTVPSYQVLIRRAQAAEAPTMALAIAHAELQHHRDHGRYLACPATGPVPISPGPFPAGEACWKALGIDVGGVVRYRYGVTLEDQDFVVLAEGDLDRDGQGSRYVVRGSRLEVEVEEPLE